MSSERLLLWPERFPAFPSSQRHKVFLGPSGQDKASVLMIVTTDWTSPLFINLCVLVIFPAIVKQVLFSFHRREN